MAGNDKKTDKQSKSAFVSFLLLFLISMGLVGYISYSLFYQVPEKESEVLRRNYAKSELDQALLARISSDMDSVFSLLENERKEPVEFLRERISKVIPDLEKNMKSIGINTKSHTQTTLYAIRHLEIIDSLHKRVIEKKIDEIDKLEEDIEELQGKLNDCKMNNQFSSNSN